MLAAISSLGTLDLIHSRMVRSVVPRVAEEQQRQRLAVEEHTAVVQQVIVLDDCLAIQLNDSAQ